MRLRAQLASDGTFGDANRWPWSIGLGQVKELKADRGRVAEAAAMLI
jgi:hypothetical protein